MNEISKIFERMSVTENPIMRVFLLENMGVYKQFICLALLVDFVLCASFQCL